MGIIAVEQRHDVRSGAIIEKQNQQTAAEHISRYDIGEDPVSITS